MGDDGDLDRASALPRGEGAAAGAPSAVSPAAARPPLTSRPRRESCASPRSSRAVFVVHRVASPFVGRAGRAGDSQLVTACALATSSIATGRRSARDRSAASATSRAARASRERARARAAVAHRVDERGELGAVRRLEALDEVRRTPSAAGGAAPGSTERSGLRASSPTAMLSAGAEDLEPDVVAERVAARPREDRERAVAEPQRGRRPRRRRRSARTTRVSRTAPSA